MEIRNNMQSPNFGMALKIGKGGREYLAKQSEKTLSRLSEIGEEMKDYKHWDLFITEKGPEAVEKGKALPHSYAGSVKIDPEASVNKYSTNRLQFDTYVGGNYANRDSKVTSKLVDLDPSDIEGAKEVFSEYTYDSPERFAVFVYFLEKCSAKDAAAKAAQEAKEAKFNGLVDDLVSKFSVDA